MIGGLWRFLPPLGVAVILLIAGILIGPVVRLSSGTLLGVFVGLILLGCVALALYLATICGRRLAALGTVLVGVAVWTAFYLSPQAAPWLVWTVLFFVGIGLIAYDVGQDTARKRGGRWQCCVCSSVGRGSTMPRTTSVWATGSRATEARSRRR
jgi:hypothetical protein